MRWFLFAILAYACLVVQTTLFQQGVLAIRISGHWAAPDLLLVAGLFAALYFEPREVFVAGWCLGLAWDLTSPAGRIGVGAILFSVLLFVLSRVRHVFGRPRILLQCFLCLGLVFAIHLAWYQAAGYFEDRPIALGRSALAAALDGLYSAILAPYLIWIFTRFRGPLRLPVA